MPSHQHRLTILMTAAGATESLGGGSGNVSNDGSRKYSVPHFGHDVGVLDREPRLPL